MFTMQMNVHDAVGHEREGGKGKSEEGEVIARDVGCYRVVIKIGNGN